MFSISKFNYAWSLMCLTHKRQIYGVSSAFGNVDMGWGVYQEKIGLNG
jgi:hypothetical protein